VISVAVYPQEKPKKKPKLDTVELKLDTAIFNHIEHQQREILKEIKHNSAK